MSEPRGGQQNLFGFRFPSAQELENSSTVQVDAAAMRQRIRRRGVLFLVSGFLPLVIGVAIAAVLMKLGSGLSDAQYFSILLVVVIATFLSVLQWRDVAVRLWPIHAIDYYASAILNRVRNRETARDADLAYLRVVLPDLEKVMTSGVLARRLAGTSLARERFANHHKTIAHTLGECETRIVRDADAESTAALRGLAVSLLLGSWTRLPSNSDPGSLEEVDSSTPSGLITRAGNALFDKSVDKVAEGAVAALIVLGGGIAWR